MAAHDYSQFPEKSSLANKATPPSPAGAAVTTKPEGVVKPGPWKVELPSKQPRPRGPGLMVVKTAPVAVGLNEGGQYSFKETEDAGDMDEKY